MKNLINISKFVFVLFLLSCATSASSEEVALLNLAFERVTEQDPKNVFPNKHVGCEVIINKPIDHRLYKDNLGTTFTDKPVVSTQHMEDWLESALLGLKAIGINTSKGQEANKNNILLSTTLNKLYVWSHGMRLYATIVLEANYNDPSTGKAYTKNYRISGSKLNWWGADSEFATTINISANRLIEQIATDLEKQCGTTTATM